MPMRSFEELTDETAGTGGVGHLIPADVYADLMLEGVVCYGQLSGVVTALEYDLTAGCGQIVQVPYIAARTDSCASKSACMDTANCLSATSSTFGTYSIAINMWGDYDLLCNFALWEANCFPIMKLIMNEMSKRMAHCRDAEVYHELSNNPTWYYYAVSDVSCTDASVLGSCCTFSFNLYNSIVSVIQGMRSDCYEPDYVILAPDVAKYMYYKDGAGYFNTPLVTFNNGRLSEILGCRVIETGVANACGNSGGPKDTVTPAAIQAIIIDSKRAVGEAWGMKPKFSTSYVPECDNTKLVLWQYWGTRLMDRAAAGYVVNPIDGM